MTMTMTKDEFLANLNMLNIEEFIPNNYYTSNRTFIINNTFNLKLVKHNTTHDVRGYIYKTSPFSIKKEFTQYQPFMDDILLRLKVTK